MSSPPIPDPYLALGVDKNATATRIKSCYHKLVLQTHPDKVADDLKTAATDAFHRIQQAYEILGDEDRKDRYDAQVRLAELRKDVLQKARTAAPFPTTSPARSGYATRAPDHVPEERKPPKQQQQQQQQQQQPSPYDMDADYFTPPRPSTSSRRFDYAKEFRKHAWGEPEKVKVYESRMREDRRRTSEMKRTKDRERKYGRPVVELDSDEDYQELPRRRRTWEDELGDFRRAKEYPEYSRSSFKPLNVEPELYVKESTKRAKSNRLDDTKASTSRKTSSKDVHEDVYRSSGRPNGFLRRSSTARTSSYSRDDKRRDRERERKYSVPEARPQPPPLQTYKSSPTNVKMAPEPRRASTQHSAYESVDFTPPTFKRSESMPVYGSTSNTRTKGSSKLRQTELPGETEFRDGLETPRTSPSPTDAYPTTSATKYRVEEIVLDSNGTRTHVLREQDPPIYCSRRMTTSPQPIESRSERKSSRSSARAASGVPQPPPIRTDTYTICDYSPQDTPVAANRPSPPVRSDSERPLFVEVPSTATPERVSKSEKERTKRYDYSDATPVYASTRGRESPREEKRSMESPRDRESSSRMEKGIKERYEKDNRERERYMYSPEMDNIRWGKRFNQEDIKMTSGYSANHVPSPQPRRRSNVYATSGAYGRPSPVTRLPSSVY